MLENCYGTCSILTSDPAKHAIPKTAEVHILLVWASLSDNMGQGYNPMVQLQTDAPEESDLWTAWQLFSLDDDRTCHSKDGGNAYSDGKLWGDIEWAWNYYITRLRQEVSYSLEKRVIKKASTQQREPSGPRSMSFGDQRDGERML